MSNVFSVKVSVAAAVTVLTIAAASSAQPAVQVQVGQIISHGAPADMGGDPGTIRIVAASNGTFSGKVVVKSARPIKGLQAFAGPLKMATASVPADNVQVRFATAFGREWARRRPPGLDILNELPPAQVRVDGRRGAKADVWVTVTVPRDAKPGIYNGSLTVQAAGLAATAFPIEMTVVDWTIPDTQEWATWIGMIQSPDSLALEYNTPLWSEKHWELIGRSFDYMSELGCRNVFIPILARTNFGNAESMVRWIPRPDGTYEWDFTIMDKYLDLAARRLGAAKMVTFQVWELYLAPRSLSRSVPFNNTEAAKAGRKALQGKGPRVTTLDPATGKLDMVYLPRFEDPAGERLWRPLFAELRKRMAARGLEKAMNIGVISDVWPSKQEVAFLKKVSGNLPWVSHAHPGKLLGKPAVGNRLLHKNADIGYEAHVYRLTYQVNPDKGRRYGWRHPEKVARFARNGGVNTCSPLQMHLMPAFNITGGQSGIGRIGADVWLVIKDKKGKRAGAAYNRYPEVNWRNLDIESWMVAPGPDGAIGTSRFENLREGLQECEARIALERALLSPAAPKRLGAELAKRCEDLLNERQRAMWRTVWSVTEELDLLNIVRNRNPVESVWHGLTKQGKELPKYWDPPARKLRREEAAKGHAWFLASDWKGRNEKLFRLAGEVARKLAGE